MFTYIVITIYVVDFYARGIMEILDRLTEVEMSEVTFLSEREAEVLQRKKQGMSNGEIAEELEVSENTVRTLVSRAARKGDKANRTLDALRDADYYENHEWVED